MNRKLSFPLLFTAIILISGCSIWKSRGFKTPTGLVYHNTTARYNAYYYGRLKLLETQKKLTQANADDYTDLLSLYPYTIKKGGASSVDMDSVIRRLTIVINLHPKSKWVDDCYYYIGLAYYFKGDFESALATFQYIAATYKDKVKKKKHPSKTHYHKVKYDKDKKKENPALAIKIPFHKTDADKPFAFIKHQPIRNKALLWLVRCYIEKKKFADAALIMQGMKDNVNFPYKLRDEMEVVNADMYLKQKKYDEAIEPLKLSIALTKYKSLKTRYAYILAQVYQLANKSDYAVKAFQAVLEMNPDIEMQFYTNISLAKASLSASHPDYAAIITLLEELAKNDKFFDYRDQIYYTIAEIYLKQNNENSAIANLKKSVETSTTNQNQKGLSFLKLAELSDAKEKYKPAKVYYDSTITFIDKKYKNLTAVKARKKVLDKWYAQVIIIEQEDSLQYLASLPEKERNKIIDDIISDLQKQMEQDSLNKNINNNNLLVDNDHPNPQNSGSSFFAYNAALKASGYSEFQKKWGLRKNEDDWRRSNKTSDAQSGDLGDGPDSSKLVKTIGPDGLTRQQFLKNLPITPEQLTGSNDRILNAYMALANVYKYDMNKPAMAIETLEKALTRFPENKFESVIWYELYLLYLNANNQEKAEYYKNLILTKYPNSDYAHIILDPNYFNKKVIQDNSVMLYYDTTYLAYKAGNYNEAKIRLAKSDSIFKSNPIKAKYDLLKALCIGQTRTKEEFKLALTDFIKKYQMGEENKHAKEILALLGDYQTGLSTNVIDGNKIKDTTGTNPKDQIKHDKSPYVYSPKNTQNLIVVFSEISPMVNACTDSIVKFNSKYFSLDKYKTNNMLLDTKQQMVIVKQMADANKGMDYYHQLMTQPFWTTFSKLEYHVFLIDDKNFSIFYQKKNIIEYLEFFDSSYGQ